MNSKCRYITLIMSAHYFIGIIKVFSNSEHIYITAFSTHEHFILLTARKCHNHIGMCVWSRNINCFFSLEFLVPDYNISSFITWDEWLFIFLSAYRRYRALMPSNRFNTSFIFPKIQTTISHSRDHVVLRFSFVLAL